MNTIPRGRSLRCITNAVEDDGRWAVRLAELKAKWQNDLPAGSPMRVNFKRDHEKRKRVQCAIGAAGFSDVFWHLFEQPRTLQLEAALDALPVPDI